MPRTDVVIVNWNAGDQLRACLASLASARESLGCVVVVDNASTDDSLDGLESLGFPLLIVRNAANRGFAAACNQGARAVTTPAPYLLFLNPDTTVSEASLAEPLAYLESEPKIAAVGISLVDESGHVARSCARQPTLGTMTATALGINRFLPATGYVMSNWDHGADRDVEHIIGAFYLMRRATFDELEGFDERFFVYLEDLDLSRRILARGHRIRFLASVQAFHRGGGTSESAKAARLAYSLRSRLAFCRKHLSPLSHAWIATCTLTAEPLIRIAYALVRGRTGEVRDTIQAYWRVFLSAEKSAG